ncbi:MAG: helix-turn-helix domain-containing protein [Prevotella sp.]|jgi:AraC-like DNA-binding protein
MSKTKKPITEFSVPALLQIVGEHYKEYGVVFDSDDICIARNKQTGLGGRHPLNEPIRLRANHLLFFKSGRATYVCNLMKTNIVSGTVLAMSDSTIYTIKDFSPDCRFDVVVFSTSVLQNAAGKIPFNIFNGKRKSYSFIASETDSHLLEKCFDTLVEVCQSSTSKEHTRILALQMLVGMTDNVLTGIGTENHSREQSNAERIFSSFLSLVNKDFRKHRDLAYYADKLCISVNHLSTTVSVFSGIPPKQWIEQAIITEAKVQLRYDQQTVTQISDELNFSSPSHFCRYFRRIVGQTPKKYAMIENV